MNKQYVIITIGKAYTLKEKISNGFFSAGIYRSKDLDKVKQFATAHNMEVVAIGDIYEV